MEVHIRLEQSDPPVGWLCQVRNPSETTADDRRELRFTGWLGLLRALAELIAPTETAI